LRVEFLSRFDIEDHPLIVAKVGEKYCVADCFCTHQEADLSLGIISDEIIECPLHHAKFNVTNGRVVAGPDETDTSSIKNLRTYETKVENGKVWADL
jgi:nitrite reductase/ring-hydroxylating ferredoxin subunit